MTSRPRARLTSAAVAALTLGAALAGCATVSTTTNSGAPSSGSTSSAGATSATASPTVSYPFTPAATPTIMPAGADAKPSKGGPTLAPTAGGPLNGKIVVVDPGHSGAYAPDIYNTHPDSPWGPYSCVSTGTETAKGVTPHVTEHELNWIVANKTADALRADGATVILTRPNDNGAGPCNIDRANIANAAHADFYMSIHTDGQAPNSLSKTPQGFHVQTETKMVGGAAVYQKSMAAAENLVRNMQSVGQQPITNYVPRKPAAIWQRTRELTMLGGLKTTPGILMEMGNLKDPQDLARITNPANQDLMAKAIVATVEDTLLNPQYMTPSPEPTTASPSASASGTPATPATASAPTPTPASGPSTPGVTPTP